MKLSDRRREIQAQYVALSIKLIQTLTNTHQSNSYFGLGPGVSSTGGCSGSTYALDAANSSQLIIFGTFFMSGSKLYGLIS